METELDLKRRSRRLNIEPIPSIGRHCHKKVNHFSTLDEQKGTKLAT